jgi:hypothetical protein
VPRSLEKSSTAPRRDVVSAGLHLSVNPSCGGRQEARGRIMRLCVGATASPCFDSELRISRAVRSTYNIVTIVTHTAKQTTKLKSQDTFIASDFQENEQSRSDVFNIIYTQDSGQDMGTGCGGSQYVPSHFREAMLFRWIRHSARPRLRGAGLCFSFPERYSILSTVFNRSIQKIVMAWWSGVEQGGEHYGLARSG